MKVKHNKRIQVLFNKELLEDLRKDAERAGLRLSPYIRNKLTENINKNGGNKNKKGDN